MCNSANFCHTWVHALKQATTPHPHLHWHFGKHHSKNVTQSPKSFFKKYSLPQIFFRHTTALAVQIGSNTANIFQQISLKRKKRARNLCRSNLHAHITKYPFLIKHAARITAANISFILFVTSHHTETTAAIIYYR